MVWSGIVNLNIPSNFNGLYLNVLTGAYNTTGGTGGTVEGGWHINPYGTTGLSWFQSTSNGVGYLKASGSTALANLAVGTLIDGSSTYGSGGASTNLTLNGTSIVGFRFTLDGGTHYGWFRVSLSDTYGGQPRSIVEYAFESEAGVPIAAGEVASTSCLADIDGNGLVNAGDLGKLLSEWGDPCCGSDLTGDGLVDAGDIAVLLSEWLTECPPGVDAVSPSSGLLTGGTVVEITGSHLAAASEITFGGVPAAEVTVIDGTRLLAVTPAAKTAGVVDIRVTTPFGAAVLADAFQFASPVPWATVLEVAPDPLVITDPAWRDRIAATGLPWRVRDNASQIEMLLVPPGTFNMGCSPSQQYGCGGDEFPVHEVILTQPFYLGRYEVTQAQWIAVIGSNPSYFAGQSNSPSRPVERVSWDMVQTFELATGLRLPTEAEREFACRAGTTSAISNGSNDEGSLSEVAWYNQSSGGQSQVVGLKPANALGFHDMHGNVWEWVEDWYAGDYYEQSPVDDPPGPPSGSSKVRRGGS